MALRPPTFDINANDEGGIAVVVSTILMTWSLLTLLIRILTRFSGPALLGIDDLLCIAATVVGVIETIVACVSVQHGFGKTQALLSSRQLFTSIEKYQYALTLLCLLAITITKCTMVFFHVRITPRNDQKRVCYAFLGIIVAAGIASICIEGARCGAAEPWLLIDRKCTGYETDWKVIAALDIVLEVALLAVPLWILFGLQMAFKTKLVIVLAFALRLPVIAAAIAHVYYVQRWRDAAKPLVAAVTPFVCLQVEVHYAIMATTFPCLGPFMKSLNTRWGTMDPAEASTYALESLPGSKSRTNASPKASKGRSQNSQQDRDANWRVGEVANSYSYRVRSGREPRVLRSKGSDDSDQMIIHKTTDTMVEYDR